MQSCRGHLNQKPCIKMQGFVILWSVKKRQFFCKRNEITKLQRISVQFLFSGRNSKDMHSCRGHIKQESSPIGGLFVFWKIGNLSFKKNHLLI